MDQSSQPTQPVIPYQVPTYQQVTGAAMVTGAPAMLGPTQPHQLAYQQVQQFHQQQQQHQQQQLQAFWAQQMSEIEQTTDFKNHSLPLARIKKIMKADEDVRMISAEAPVVFAKACELFILELTLRAWIHTEENKRRTLQKNDIAAAITRTDIFDFLVDIVPRDELKDEGLGMARAAGLPGIGTGVPGDGATMPQYYYMPVQSGMIMGKPVVDQGGATGGPSAPMYGGAYMWQQPPVSQVQSQHTHEQQEQSDE